MVAFGAAQSISGISPIAGQAGDVVKINGSGFAATMVVNFGPKRASVLASTATQLTVQVPNGQPLGPTSVTVGGSAGRSFITIARSKIALPSNPPAACRGTTGLDGCSCRDNNSSQCVSKGAYLGGTTNNNNIYGERGEFFQDVTDMNIPGRPGAGPAGQFAVQRQYRAAVVTNGPLGNKWNHSYFESLQVEPGGSVVHQDGSGRSDLYLLNNLGTFVAPPEFYTTLTHNPDGSYSLQYKDRTIKKFDATGKLQAISDRNGNALTFGYSLQGQLATVTDTLGRPITYTYDSNGRLTRITDFAGRIIAYTYDSAGDLVSATTPAVTGTPNGNDFPSGKTPSYTYDSKHLLLTIVRPNEVANSGSPVLQNTYDSHASVISQIYGGTNASGIPSGGTYRYTYTPLNSGVTSDDPNLPVMTTQQTDRNGNVTQYDFNRLGYPLAIREYTRGLRPTDPPAYTTTKRYNSDGRLTQTTQAAGNTVQYTYDEGNPERFQQGNLLQESYLPDPSH